jgi:hypothetical protein
MKRILRTLACTGLLGIAAAAAQAQVGVYLGVRAPISPVVVAAVPPCPGDGYIWTAGYYAGRTWYPGRWVYRGYDRGYVARGFYGHPYREFPGRYRR